MMALPSIFLWALFDGLLIATLVSLVVAHDGYRDTFKMVKDANGCTTLVHNFDPLLHKPKYRVGVFSSEGDEAVYRNYNTTFAEYLTATAGRRFDPPIEFDLIPVTLTSLMNMAEEEAVDFSFTSSAVFSCMATEHKAQPMVTVIARRKSRGREYDLDKYGGVMFTLAGNEDVNSIEDFKDRTIGAGGITMMGGGQTQFYEMVTHGLSYVADPKQVVFTFEEQLTVQGVLDGEFEIGFARTDQIERHVNANGEALPEDTFKIINPQTHKLDDGTLFPFVSSTGLHPEWPVAALDHVSPDVSREVQEALLALRDHAGAVELNETLRCDTTPALARLALKAKTDGKLTGFRTARSYFEVRTKQETAGLVRKSEKGTLHCIRGETLYNDVECPDQHYKLTEDEFHMSCERVGLPCKEGFECYCKPCVKAFEVDVFQVSTADGGVNSTGAAEIKGCEKMSLCGNIEQTKTIVFRAVDNVKRQEAKVEVWIHLEHRSTQLDVKRVPNEPFVYEFQYAQGEVGVGILEIFFDGDQIPESPIRVQVEERRCDLDYPGTGRVADADGSCICNEDTVKVGSKCVETKVFAIAGSFLVLVLIFSAAYAYMLRRNRKNDAMWQVKVDELNFDDPVEVIGEGSFGVVLLAEYRGTKVAIKRAIKSGTRSGSTKGSTSRKSTSRSTDQPVAPVQHRNYSMDTGGSDNSPGSVTPSDVENPPPDAEAVLSTVMEGIGRSRRTTDGINLGFLNELYGGTKNTSKWGKMWPFWRGNHHYRKNYHIRFKESILGGSLTISGRSFAARICPCFSPQVRQREEFVAEMRILSRLRHPCITTVMGAVINNTHDPMLVMEYMSNGSLHDLLRNQTMYLSGEIIMQITRDIGQGLRYLHSSKPPILHGDLKARNILVDSRFRAKICDFGLSTKRDHSITGTPLWLAPEYLRGEVQYNSSCDMYSMGIIFYEIYSRKNPYEGEDFREVLRKVCNRRINKRPTIPPATPPKMADLMKKCWSPDALFRPQAKDLDMTLMDMNVEDAEPLTEHQDYDLNSTTKKEMTRDMLYELFPKHIADALKAGEKVEPQQHDLVTVIFSDIVNFTTISREISPLKVSDMLDRLYLTFDKIAKKHEVFKVETIGDAYMGVTNLENNQEDCHVKQAAEFAVDLINEGSKILIDEECPGMGYIQIRVGFHSGPVVSNVIGSLNPRYGLFGDTVNTASRMESNSEANRILCSSRSHRLLKEQAPSMPDKKHGKINVKGKGEMHVYWVGDGLINAANDWCAHQIMPTSQMSNHSDSSPRAKTRSLDARIIASSTQHSSSSLEQQQQMQGESSGALSESLADGESSSAEKLLEQRVLERLMKKNGAPTGYPAVVFADPE